MKQIIFAVTLSLFLTLPTTGFAGKKTVYITGGGDEAVTIKKHGTTIIILPEDGGKFGTDKFDPPDDRFRAPDESKYKLPDRYKAPDDYKLPDFFIHRNKIDE